jgi:peptidoglycan/xylan/chitin deacetylase (PgdA/CDA1 family)
MTWLHAYLQDKPMNGMTPEEEEATIMKCLDLLEKTSGQRPQGWVSQAWRSHRTLTTCCRLRG